MFSNFSGSGGYIAFTYTHEACYAGKCLVEHESPSAYVDTGYHLKHDQDAFNSDMQFPRLGRA